MTASSDQRQNTAEAGQNIVPGGVLIAIVNWRTADLTIDCLRSVASEIDTVSSCRVVVVDNGSGDDSADRLERAIEDNGWQGWARLIRSSENLGFAGGNNIALREMLEPGETPEFAILLNPDTIVRPGAFQILVDFMKSHPEVGIAGGRSEDPDETPQACCFRFPNFFNEVSRYLKLGIFDRIFSRFMAAVPIPQEPRPIDWVSGALMIVRHKVFNQIGLLDDGFFLYFEETDFTLRAARAGWTCWHVPESRVVHLVGQSSGISQRDQRPPRRPQYWFDSRHRYFVKNHGALYAILVDAGAILALAAWNARRFITRKPQTDPPKLLSDMLRNSVILRGTRLLSAEEARPSRSAATEGTS